MADGTSGGCGTTYEMLVCMLCLVRGFTRGLTNFRLRYQAKESEFGKFDDVVFDEGGEIFQVFQLKHKEKAGQIKLNSSHLFHENFSTDFNLLKYVHSYFKTMKDKVKMAVVVTPADCHLHTNNQLKLLANSKDWFQKLNSIELHPLKPKENAIIDTSNSFPDAKCYKFDNDPNIVLILKRQAETVSKELREKQNKQNQTKPIKEAEDETNKKYKKQQEQIKENDEVLEIFLENLEEKDIREALQHIVYAVRQPNDTELEEIIKNEIEHHFKLQSVETVYNTLENAIKKWCNNKLSFVAEMTDPHIIDFKATDIFFQKYVKNISFGAFAPISSFTGRLEELDLIRTKLEEKHGVIVSQSITISGLGGIGKTELTKKFIKEFGQSDFYGRVIWIEAESDETVTKSFKALAEKLEIQDIEKKLTTTIIEQSFEYFHGVKVLFVFDNFDKSDEYTEDTDHKQKNFVQYCRKIASASTKNHRPYLMFTSRNRECLPGVFSFDLSVLKKEDANEFITKGLLIKDFTNQDVEELAKTLQYFPLALKQAIAYINEQHKIESVLGGGYDIQKYLREFTKKKKELLNYPYKNDFGEHGQTTLVTWNVTFDAIKKDEIHGHDAIKILQFMSYLYADKIDAKIFLPFFKNDKTRTGKAFLLLQKYSLITETEEISFYQIHRLVQTVVRLNFKDNEQNNLQNLLNLIFPELYKSYFVVKDYYRDWSCIHELMGQCTIDQVLHYNNLANYIKNNGGGNKTFQTFFDDLSDRFLISACFNDDIDKIKALQLSPEELQRFIKEHDRRIIEYDALYTIKYFVENGYLDLNALDLPKVLRYMLRNSKFRSFKYLMQKEVSLNILKIKAPINLIHDIIKGNSDLLLNLIESEETEENNMILKESLFFASLFNQESIVELLSANKVEPDYILIDRFDYAPIRVAAKLNYPNILKSLLTVFDKSEFKDIVAKIIFKLLDGENFCGKNFFEILFKKYLELGGNINDQHDRKGNTFLNYVTFSTISPFVASVGNSSLYNLNYVTQPGYFSVKHNEIVNFLLDNGADPFVKNHKRCDVFIIVFIAQYVQKDPNVKALLENLYTKMLSKIPKEILWKRMKNCLFEIVEIDNVDALSGMLKQGNFDINLKNHKRETLLIRLVRKATTCQEDTVKFLLDAGIDVDAKDNFGNDALFYAVDRIFPSYFNMILPKVSFVGESILREAIKKDKVNIVEELLKSHFKLNHIFEDGKTLLEVVLEKPSINIMLHFHPKIKELSFQEGERERIAEKVQMALIKYIQNTSIEKKVVDVFVELGADVNALDSDRKKALKRKTSYKKPKLKWLRWGYLCASCTSSENEKKPNKKQRFH